MRTCLTLASTLVVAALATGCASTRAQPAPERSTATPAVRESRLAELGFMAGSWVFAQEGATTEEHWSRPSGGTMIGMGRTVANARTVFFEFLMIEERVPAEPAAGSADGAIVYVARPRAGTPTDFRLTELARGRAVFTNPDHDFPQRIEYHRDGDGALVATVEGAAETGGGRRSEEYRYRPSR